MLGVTPEGRIAPRVAVVSQGDRDRSLSGEFRLIGEWQSGQIAHRLTGSVRGRSRNRLFGGSKRALAPRSGPGTVFDTPDNWPEPAYTLDPEEPGSRPPDRRRTRYSLFWQGKASFDFGISKQHYKKSIDFGDPALADPTTRDRPVLWNARCSVALTRT